MATIKYGIRAVWAALTGKEIEFALNQIEAWLKGNENQRITDAVYLSKLDIELNEPTNGGRRIYGND